MNKGRFITILIVAIAAIGFFAWLTNSYVLQSRADEDTVDIIVNPKEGLVPNTPINFIIQPQSADQKIAGADITINVENGTLTSWEECTHLQEEAGSKTFLELGARTGSNARYGCAADVPDADLPGHVIMGGTFTCSGTETMRVTVDTENSLVTGPQESVTYAFGSVEAAEFNCGGTGDEDPVSEDIIAEFTPENCNANVGESCTYNLDVRSTNNQSQISGLYVKLAYDEDILSATSVTPQGSVQGVMLAQSDDEATPSPTITLVQPTTTTNPTPTIPRTTTSPTNVPPVTVTPTPTPISKEPAGCSIVDRFLGDGFIEYLYTCNSPAESLPTAVSQQLEFAARANGSGTLSIAAIQVVGPRLVGSYSVNKGSATYDIGGGAGDGNVTLDMSLRMQCVVKRPQGAQEMKVRIGLGDGPLQNPVYKDATFRVDDNGHWNGTVSFNVPAGSGYKILPKGEKHMQKKVCENNAREDFPGAYGCDRGTITLQEGINTIDLTDIVLLTGDLPPGEQDGISNAKDQSLVRNLIGSRDEESAMLADVNYDGVVNAVDHSCMIAALSVRWDEE